MTYGSQISFSARPGVSIVSDFCVCENDPGMYSRVFWSFASDFATTSFFCFRAGGSGEGGSKLSLFQPPFASNWEKQGER